MRIAMRFIVTLMVAAALWGAAAAAEAETVSGRETSGKAFLWNYGFDADLSDHAVKVRVLVNFIPAGGCSRAELERAKAGWRERIDQVWNGKFCFVTADGTRYPIVVSFVDAGPGAHYEVVVRKSGRNTNLLNWNLSDSAGHAAHEFGHMLGAFDEYAGGATGPQGKELENSVMTNRPSGNAYPRHYEKIKVWFLGKTGLADVSIEPMVQQRQPGKGRT